MRHVLVCGVVAFLAASTAEVHGARKTAPRYSGLQRHGGDSILLLGPSFKRVTHIKYPKDRSKALIPIVFKVEPSVGPVGGRGAGTPEEGLLVAWEKGEDLPRVFFRDRDKLTPYDWLTVEPQLFRKKASKPWERHPSPPDAIVQNPWNPRMKLLLYHEQWNKPYKLYLVHILQRGLLQVMELGGLEQEAAFEEPYVIKPVVPESLLRKAEMQVAGYERVERQPVAKLPRLYDEEVIIDIAKRIAGDRSETKAGLAQAAALLAPLFDIAYPTAKLIDIVRLLEGTSNFSSEPFSGAVGHSYQVVANHVRTLRALLEQVREGHLSQDAGERFEKTVGALHGRDFSRLRSDYERWRAAQLEVKRIVRKFRALADGWI